MAKKPAPHRKEDLVTQPGDNTKPAKAPRLRRGGSLLLVVRLVVAAVAWAVIFAGGVFWQQQVDLKTAFTTPGPVVFSPANPHYEARLQHLENQMQALRSLSDEQQKSFAQIAKIEEILATQNKDNTLTPAQLHLTLSVLTLPQVLAFSPSPKIPLALADEAAAADHKGLAQTLETLATSLKDGFVPQVQLCMGAAHLQPAAQTAPVAAKDATVGDHLLTWAKGFVTVTRVGENGPDTAALAPDAAFDKARKSICQALQAADFAGALHLLQSDPVLQNAVGAGPLREKITHFSQQQSLLLAARAQALAILVATPEVTTPEDQAKAVEPKNPKKKAGKH